MFSYHPASGNVFILHPEEFCVLLNDSPFAGSYSEELFLWFNAPFRIGYSMPDFGEMVSISRCFEEINEGLKKNSGSTLLMADSVYFHMPYVDDPDNRWPYTLVKETFGVQGYSASYYRVRAVSSFNLYTEHFQKEEESVVTNHESRILNSIVYNNLNKETDVIAVRNSNGNQFTDYIWYKDGSEFSRGSGYILITDPGIYHVEVNGVYQGKTVSALSSCPQVFSPQGGKVIVHPTLLPNGGTIHISIHPFLEEDLQGTFWQLIDMSGILLSQGIITGPETSFTLSTTAGNYILRVITGKESTKEFKITVKN